MTGRERGRVVWPADGPDLVATLGFLAAEGVGEVVIGGVGPPSMQCAWTLSRTGDTWRGAAGDLGDGTAIFQ